MHFLKKLIQITDIGATIYNLSCLSILIISVLWPVDRMCRRGIYFGY